MKAEHGPERPVLPPVSDHDQEHLLKVGHEASAILEAAGVQHMAGGGVAVWAYGRRRMTKDIDLFLPFGKQGAAMDALCVRGYHTRDTDAGWLYKAFKDDVMIDLITFTTGEIRLDDETFEHVRRLKVDGYEFPLMGPEDVVFRKIYSTDETRFHDWYDALAILKKKGADDFQWDYFEKLARTRALERTVSFLFFALADREVRSNVPIGILRGLLGATGVMNGNGKAGEAGTEAGPTQDTAAVE